MPALSTLCDIIAQRGKVARREYALRDEFDLLIARGFVCDKGAVQSLVCDDCDAPHDAEIVFHEGGYGIFCPDLGFIPIANGHQIAIVADVGSLVAALAEFFQCRRRKNSPIHGQTWRIGAIETHRGDLALFFHPCLHSSDDMGDLDAALRNEIVTTYQLVITASGALSLPNVKTARLDDVVFLNAPNGAFRGLASPSEIVGVPKSVVNGRPNEFRDRLFQIFSSRKRTDKNLEGRNDEARRILLDFKKIHPNDHAPSLSLVQRYVTDFRRGS